jgi:hypothetical protein
VIALQASRHNQLGSQLRVGFTSINCRPSSTVHISVFAEYTDSRPGAIGA